MNYPVLERPVEAGITTVPSFENAPFSTGGASSRGFAPADMISRMFDPTSNALNSGPSPLSWLFPGFNGMAGFGIGNMLAKLASMLEQFMQSSQTTGSPFNDNEQFFSSASGASVGDPHLSFNGRTWDNMGSQPDLLHSDSFDGGYQLSTQTTPPAANGVTYNQQATVTTGNGATHVSLDKDGNATIDQNGYQYSIAPGQTMDLGNGELVARNADGSLQVTCSNGNGGQITTTMRSNGTGVDVSTTANNVDLGGTLATTNPIGHPVIPL